MPSRKTDPRQRNDKRFISLFKATITILLLFVLLTRTPVEEMLDRILGIGPWTIVGCIAALFFMTVIGTLRWMIVLRHQADGRPRFLQLWHYLIVGSFFNQFIPSGLGGDAFRIWYVHRDGISLGSSIASVVVDRVLGLLAVFTMAVLGLPYLLAVTVEGPVRTLILVIAALMAFAISCFLRMDIVAQMMRHFQKLRDIERNHIRVKRVMEEMERTAATTRLMLGSWPDGPLALGLSLLNQAIFGVIVFALARAAGDNTTLAAAMFLFPYVLFLSLIPISLGGWGMREGAMVVVFALVGMSTSSALTISILFGLCMLITSLPGGILWLRKHPASLKEEVSEIEQKISAAQRSQISG